VSRPALAPPASASRQGAAWPSRKKNRAGHHGAGPLDTPHKLDAELESVLLVDPRHQPDRVVAHRILAAHPQVDLNLAGRIQGMKIAVVGEVAVVSGAPNGGAGVGGDERFGGAGLPVDRCVEPSQGAILLLKFLGRRCIASPDRL